MNLFLITVSDLHGQNPEIDAFRLIVEMRSQVLVYHPIICTIGQQVIKRQIDLGSQFMNILM